MATKTLFKVIGDGGDTVGASIVDVDGALRLKMGANYVLAEQQAAVSAATGTADASAAVNNVITALIAHGLLASA